ncbi:MAG: methyltransferase domain-containing protein [Steroidobacteraceae bacterium]
MTTSDGPSENAAQIEYWNATAGETWALFQEQLDHQIEPLGLEALRVLAPAPGEAILDIGCGCGQTTWDLASRVRSDGHVVGIDISAPMLEVARRRRPAARALQPEFRKVDAQSGDLGRAVFDAAFSRFGVMFFSDPIAAFSNVRQALKPHGRLGFVCWRPLQENIWMLVPLNAALPLLPPPIPADPLAPGPFAFADAARVRSILHSAGFGSVSIQPFDLLIGSGDIEKTLALTFKVGPLGAALRENPQQKDKVAEAVRGALTRYATPSGVLMPAAVWVVLAHNELRASDA